MKRSQPGGYPPFATTPGVVDYVNAHLVDYVNVTPSHLVDSVNADTMRDPSRTTNRQSLYRALPSKTLAARIANILPCASGIA